MSGSRSVEFTRDTRGLLALLVAVMLVLAGCGGDDGDNGDSGQDGQDGQDATEPPDEPVTIRLGWNPTVSSVEQVSLMITDPELAPNLGTWYELEVTEFPGTPEIIQGLAAGALDVGSGGALAFANGLDQGADFVLTAQYTEEREGWGQTNWMTRKDSGITSAADVADKTVSVNSVGAYVDYVADAYLRAEAGLEPDRDYEKVEIPFPQQQDALQAGQTDLAVIVVPFVPRAEATGEFETLFTSVDVQEQVVALQGWRPEFVEGNRVAVEKFMEDHLALSRYLADPENREVVVSSFVETSGQEFESADAFLLTESDLYRPPDAAVDTELLQENWDFYQEQGAFDSRLEVEDYLMPELLPDQ
jgi:ABC-type nitrate/sulfonate/bicarbonate transport system substrate-binding protein